MTALNRTRWAKWLWKTPLHPQWLLGSRKTVAEWIRMQASGRVLDIGCADQWICPHLPQGCDYTALDYLPTGGRMYGARPDVFADAARLPFGDATFDTVLLLEVMEHLKRPSQAWSEIGRVLKPGGCLLMTMPFLYPVHDAPHDYQRYTRYGVEREIASVGLAVVELEPSLGAVKSGGLLYALALGGIASEVVASRHPAVFLLPALLAGIVGVNLASWLLAMVTPGWPALTAGYRIRATKP